MAIVAADVQVPTGEIDGALFYPSTAAPDISTRLSAYIAQGYSKATLAGIEDTDAQDNIARIYTYYRAWSDVVNRLTMTPASSQLEGEGSVTMLQTQIEQWILARDRYADDLAVLLPDDNKSKAQPQRTQSVPTRFCF